MIKQFSTLCHRERLVQRVHSGTVSRLLRAVVVVAMALAMYVPASANAACGFNSGSMATANIDLGSVTAPANAAIGTVITTKQVSYDNVTPHQTFTCGTNVPSAISFQMSGNGTSNTYETNIPGIGIRVSVWSSSAGYYSTPSTATLAPLSWNYSIPESTGVYGTGYLQVRVDLVVTGPSKLSGTNALSYNVGPWFTTRTADGTSQLTVSNLAVQAAITTRTCSVTQSSVAVTLPPAVASKLPSQGSATGTTPFNLQLACSQGANVNVTLTDATDTSNRSAVLNLAQGSFASGVGLQILSGSTPISYGPDSANAGNTNQWSVGTAAGGAMNIPLTVQYVRTSGTLVPGTVKGIATFTMSYQ